MLCHWACVGESASEERREVYVTTTWYILIKNKKNGLVHAIHKTNID